MTKLDAATIDRLSQDYPEAFRASFWKRYAGLIGIAVCALYTVYCWWFFSIGLVLGSANWQLASNYLADWVSYEIRPDIEIKQNHLEISYSRFSELGENPDPDWLIKDKAIVETFEETAPAASQATSTQSSSGSFVAPSLSNVGNENSTKSSSNSFVAPSKSNVGNANSTKSSSDSFVAPSRSNVGTDTPGIAQTPETAAPVPVRSEQVVRADVQLGAWDIIVEPKLVTVTHGGKSYLFDMTSGQAVMPLQPLEPWAADGTQTSTLYLTLGWAGRAEIQNDEVVIWKRFFGWANFVFDTTSPFWGKPATEVIGLMFSDQRVDPTRSNISRAFNDVWYNLEWQHGDVWIKLLQTIVMAFVGTVLASLIAFPLSFLAARNIYNNRPANQVLKRFFDFLRSVDMLIWALFFTRAFGPGPLAGISAIFFTDTGTLGKLYSEALENIDDKQREGVKSVGASPISVQRYGVLPQVLPVFASQALYFWESNTRSATIIGAVGAGGIGLKLWEAMRTNQDWENVAYMVLLILVVVYIFDAISSRLRGMLIGKGQL